MTRGWLTLLLLLAAAHASAGTVFFSEGFEGDTVGVPPFFGIRAMQTNVSCGSFNLIVNSTAPITGAKDFKSTSLNSWYRLVYTHISAPADSEISVDTALSDAFVFLRSNFLGTSAYFFRHIQASNLVQFGKAFSSANNCPVAAGPHPVVTSSILLITPPINPAGVRTLKFRIEGTTLTGFLNGVQVIQTTDSSHSGPGFFGFGGIKAGQFDNVLVVDLAEPPGDVPTGQVQSVIGGFTTITGGFKAAQ